MIFLIAMMACGTQSNDGLSETYTLHTTDSPTQFVLRGGEFDKVYDDRETFDRRDDLSGMKLWGLPTAFTSDQVRISSIKPSGERTYTLTYGFGRSITLYSLEGGFTDVADEPWLVVDGRPVFPASTGEKSEHGSNVNGRDRWSIYHGEDVLHEDALYYQKGYRQSNDWALVYNSDGTQFVLYSDLETGPTLTNIETQLIVVEYSVERPGLYTGTDVHGRECVVYNRESIRCYDEIGRMFTYGDTYSPLFSAREGDQWFAVSRAGQFDSHDGIRLMHSSVARPIGIVMDDGMEAIFYGNERQTPWHDEISWCWGIEGCAGTGLGMGPFSCRSKEEYDRGECDPIYRVRRGEKWSAAWGDELHGGWWDTVSFAGGPTNENVVRLWATDRRGEFYIWGDRRFGPFDAAASSDYGIVVLRGRTLQLMTFEDDSSPPTFQPTTCEENFSPEGLYIDGRVDRWEGGKWPSPGDCDEHMWGT